LAGALTELRQFSTDCRIQRIGRLSSGGVTSGKATAARPIVTEVIGARVPMAYGVAAAFFLSS
jgi:hypothetical protein